MKEHGFVLISTLPIPPLLGVPASVDAVDRILAQSFMGHECLGLGLLRRGTLPQTAGRLGDCERRYKRA